MARRDRGHRYGTTGVAPRSGRPRVRRARRRAAQNRAAAAAATAGGGGVLFLVVWWAPWATETPPQQPYVPSAPVYSQPEHDVRSVMLDGLDGHLRLLEGRVEDIDSESEREQGRMTLRIASPLLRGRVLNGEDVSLALKALRQQVASLERSAARR